MRELTSSEVENVNGADAMAGVNLIALSFAIATVPGIGPVAAGIGLTLAFSGGYMVGNQINSYLDSSSGG